MVVSIRGCVYLAVLLLFAGCGKSIDIATWSEEVQLHDGQMIVIERVARAHPRPLLSETRGADIDFEIHYKPLGIHWKGTRQLDALEVFDGVAYVMTSAGNEVEFCKGRLPSDLPMKVWKQHAGGWVEVPVSTFQTKTALWNLYRGYWGNRPSEDAKGIVTWELKAMQDAYPTIDRKVGSPKRAFTVEEFYRENRLTCARFQTQLAPSQR